MKVVVAMSGGVDSAVSALILKSNGYEVIGVHFKTERDTFFSNFVLTHKVCCSPDDTADAKKIAKKLGIEMRIIDLHDEFKRNVISKFVNGYVNGITPNPCALCNREIKFSVLRKIANETNSDFWATGHYSRVESGKIKVAFDRKKDQSYFLSLIKKEDMKGLILPIGSLSKNKVRLIAKLNNLENSSKPDSQDVCFIPDGDLKKFFNSQHVELSPGPIITTNGEVIGEHSGYQLYAIGQRKGLGLAAGHRVYVVDIDPTKNAVIVGEREELFKDRVFVRKVNLLEDLPSKIECECKVRSTAKAIPCRVNFGDPTEVHFFEPVIPAPGQIAAFYKGEFLLGGGIMVKH